jgi:hypothetical protein
LANVRSLLFTDEKNVNVTLPAVTYGNGFNKDPQPPWVKDAPDAVGHPDQSDIVRLTEIVKERLPEFLS